MRFVVGLALVSLAVALPRTAAASERAFSVAWQAPEECPDASAVERYVDQVVGDTVSGPVTVRASGTAQRTADGRYAATLELDIGSGAPSTRSLDGRDCEAVSQAAALLIALAIRAQGTPPSVAPPAPPRPVVPPPEAPPPRAPRSGARGFLTLGPIADFGSTPTATLGVNVGGGIEWAGLRFEPTVAYFAPRSTGLADRSEVGARFSLAALGGRVCAPLSSRALWLAPCLGAGVDWLRGVGFGARVPQNGSAFSAVGRAAALLGWDVSPIISTHLELEGVVPLARQEFRVRESDEAAGFVYRRSALAARIALGLDVHF